MKLRCDFDEAYVEIEASQNFVPFVGGEAERIELCAFAAKRCLGVAKAAALDPWHAAANVDIEVRGPEYIAQFPEAIQRQVLELGSSQWSAGTLLEPPIALILLNPLHDKVRQKTTLAEELAHIVMGHPPSTIDPTTGFRTYDGDIEGEAYGVGGAMVLPYGRLFSLVKNGTTEAQIAAALEVSEPFVGYRINRVGLRRVYDKRNSPSATPAKRR